MNILIIITPYSPGQTPNIIRWESIINYYLKKGFNITVLTSIWGHLKEHENNHNLTIYRCGHHTLLDRIYNMFGTNQRRNIANSKTNFSLGLGRKILEKCVDFFWRKNYWPDGSVFFLKAAQKKLPIILEHKKITHIVSVGIPFSSHLLGRQAKASNPKIKWLMDIQDPFSFSNLFWVNNFAKYATKNIEEEGKAFDLADTITVTNVKTLELYKELFSSAANKIYIIPPILVIKESVSKKIKIDFDNSKIHVGYFGSFYKNVRSPLAFLNFIDSIYKKNKKQLKKIQFHFFGELNTFSQPIFSLYNHLDNYIIQHGLIAHNQVEEYANSMDRLISFGNVTEYHLPSKVVEYLYYNKPVINFISHDQDSSKIFLEGKINLLNLKLSNELFEVQKNEFLDFIKSNSHLDKFNPDYLPYLTEAISEKYYELLK